MVSKQAEEKKKKKRWKDLGDATVRDVTPVVSGEAWLVLPRAVWRNIGAEKVLRFCNSSLMGYISLDASTYPSMNSRRGWKTW